MHDLTCTWNLKKSNLEVESRTVDAGKKEVGEMGRYWSKSTKLQLCWMNKYRDLMYSIMTIVIIVNNIVLNNVNLLRE